LEVAQLRAQGLTLKEIGRRLGVTHQSVAALLQAAARESIPDHRCARCAAVVEAAVATARGEASALCPACLNGQPGATLGQLLVALRLAAGLTRRELARRAGMNAGMIRDYEQDRYHPTPANRAKLAQGLQVCLERLAGGAPVPGKRGRGRPRRAG
jgi:transcriptional regulator with XRE-family HTH domain